MRAAVFSDGTGAVLWWQLVARSPSGMLTIALLVWGQTHLDSYALAGAIVAGYSVGFALGAPISARMLRVFGTTRVLLVTSAISGGALASLALSHPPLPSAIGLAAVAGFTFPPVTPLARSIYSRIVPAGRLERVYALDAVAQEFIWVLGPLAATLVAGALGPPAAIGVCAAVLVIGAVVFAFLRPTRAFQPVWEDPAASAGGDADAGADPDARANLRADVHPDLRANGGADAHPDLSADVNADDTEAGDNTDAGGERGADLGGTTGTPSPVQRPSKRMPRPARFALAVLVTVGFFLVGAGALVEVLLVSNFGYEHLATGVLLAIIAVGSLVGGLTLGRRPVRARTLTARLLIVVAGMALAAPLIGVPAWLAVPLFVSGLGVAPAFAAIHTIIARVIPIRQRTEAYALSHSGQLVGMATGTAIAGVLVEHTAAPVVLLVAAGSALAAALLALVPLAARRRPPRGSASHGSASHGSASPGVAPRGAASRGAASRRRAGRRGSARRRGA